jgi:hypothetical protein
MAYAMEEAGKVGVGRFVMRNKEYVAAVRPVDAVPTPPELAQVVELLPVFAI